MQQLTIITYNILTYQQYANVNVCEQLNSIGNGSGQTYSLFVVRSVTQVAVETDVFAAGRASVSLPPILNIHAVR